MQRWNGVGSYTSGRWDASLPYWWQGELESPCKMSCEMSSSPIVRFPESKGKDCHSVLSFLVMSAGQAESHLLAHYS